MDHFTPWAIATAAGLGASLMGAVTAGKPSGTIEKSPFGNAPDGRPVELYTLRNRQGMEARIMTYGGIVVSLKTRDKQGNFGDVVLGFDSLDTYLKGHPYFGALIGRYGNRIAQGKFTLNGHAYQLAANSNGNHLHGGVKGFDKAVWKATPSVTADGPELRLNYVSKNGEENFSGTLSVTVVYTITEDNALRLDFTATTDEDTLCNLTSHSYFNLRGGGDVLDDEFQINADAFTPTDAKLIPTGELRPVAGTPFDFRQPATLRARIGQADEQLVTGSGYDHNFVVNKPAGELGLAARVFDPASGRVMEVLTTEPGVQFYTANHLNGTLTGKGGWVYQKRNAFCLEPQHFPDSPNHPEFPSVTLRPGETYRHTTIYRFSVR